MPTERWTFLEFQVTAYVHLRGVVVVVAGAGPARAQSWARFETDAMFLLSLHNIAVPS